MCGRLASNVVHDDLLHRHLVGNRHMERADVAAALDKRNDRTVVLEFAALGIGAAHANR